MDPRGDHVPSPALPGCPELGLGLSGVGLNFFFGWFLIFLLPRRL